MSEPNVADQLAMKALGPLTEEEHSKLVDVLLNLGPQALEVAKISAGSEVIIRIILRFGHSLSAKQLIDLCMVLDDQYGSEEGVLQAIRDGALEPYAKDVVALPRGYQLKS